jgi:hypothetical protein
MSSAKLKWMPVMAVVATLAVSCAATPPPASMPRGAVSALVEQGDADQRLADAVYSALNADPIYFYRHVDVSVADGVADLSGYVWSTDAIYRARKIARGVSGITGVATTHLELERNSSRGTVAR